MSKRSELVLPPGTYAYSLDRANAQMSVLVGPVQNKLEEMEGTVVFDVGKGKMVGCPIDRAIQPIVIVPANHYAVVRNPYVTADGSLAQPPSKRKTLVDEVQLQYGETMNVPGPTAIVPWPGQQVEVREGYWLAADQFVRAVVTQPVPQEIWAELVGLDPTFNEEERLDSRVAAPTVGRRFTIAGSRTSLFIPPSGVEVEGKKPAQATELLNGLSWCLLERDDGTHRFVRGPALVFPRGDEQVANEGKAYDLYECGVHTIAVAGDEVGSEYFHTRFGVTRDEPAYYWPCENEEIVEVVTPRQIREGEGIYIRQKDSVNVTTVAGPSYFLANPLDVEIVGDALQVNVKDNEAVELRGPTGSRIIIGPEHLLAQHGEQVGERLALSFVQVLPVAAVTVDGIDVKASITYLREMTGDPAGWFRQSSGRHRISHVLQQRFIKTVSTMSSVKLSDTLDTLMQALMAGGETIELGDTTVRDLYVKDLTFANRDLAGLFAQTKLDATTHVMQERRRTIGRESAEAAKQHETAIAELERKLNLRRAEIEAEGEQAKLEQRKAQQDLIDELTTYELDREARRQQQRLDIKTKEQELERSLLAAQAGANVQLLEAIQPELIAAIKTAGAQTAFSKVAPHLGPSSILNGLGLHDAVKRFIGEDAANSMLLTEPVTVDKPNGGSKRRSAEP